MPGDPLARVNPGQQWTPSASTHNALVEAAKLVLGDRATGAGRAAPYEITNGSVILVKNDTDTDIPQYGVAKFNSVIVLPDNNLAEFKARLSLRGMVTNGGANGTIEAARKPFMIAQEPVGKGAIGRFAVDGFTIAKVDVKSISHLYVEESSSTDHLQTTSRSSGIATIHFNQSSELGVQYAVIRIGNPSAAAVMSGGGIGGADPYGCDGTQCIDFPVSAGDACDVGPPEYRFQLGNLDCECEENQAGEITVTRSTDDPCLFESAKTWHCPTAAPVVRDCSKTSTWRWTLPASCTGNCLFTAVLDEHAPSGLSWSATSNTCAGSCGACDPTPIGFEPAFNGQTQSVPCASSGADPAWVLTGTTGDSDCPCDPEAPDYDGTEDGDTAETTCDSTVTEDPDDTYESFWRLRTGCISAYGEPISKLWFLVNDIVQFEFQKPWGRCWCAACDNRMELVTCGPFRCDNVPPAICVHPVAPLVPCVVCKDSELPQFWIMDAAPGSFLPAGSYLFKIPPNSCGASIDAACVDQSVTGASSGCPDFVSSPTVWDAIIANYEENGGCRPGTRSPDGNVSGAQCMLRVDLLFGPTTVTVTIHTHFGLFYVADSTSFLVDGCKSPIVLTQTADPTKTLTITPVLPA